MASEFSRREFLKVAGATTAIGMVSTWPDLATGMPDWQPGQLAHVIPTANHNRFLLKCSFKARLEQPPILTVDNRRASAAMTDTQGYCWMFDANGLTPDTRYELRLLNATGEALCDAWPLKTFPAPGTLPKHLRILAYTCGGGYDGPSLAGKTFWLDMDARRRMLDKALSFEPDVVIANGDHIYWDQETSLNKPQAEHIKKFFWGRFGELDRNIPVLGTQNEKVVRAVADYQIAGLYGARLRSIPSFFLTDDHDEFENDEFTDKLATMPASEFGLDGEDATQLMYYPEFLPDANQPSFLWGTGKAGRAPGINQFFGTLRYGDLLEAVLYDCRRFADYKGIHAHLLPSWTEDWIVRRTKAQDTAHFIHIPSLPYAYTSGKLGDWYPDVLDGNKAVLYRPKPGWQQGWLAQHQRLLAAITGQQHRVPLIVEGDFHASAAGTMTRVADLDLSKNPVHVVLGGTLGTGDYAFPSAVRAIVSAPSELVSMRQDLAPTEKNGFSIIDVTPEKVAVRMFMWRPPEPVANIDSLQPILELVFKRPA